MFFFAYQIMSTVLGSMAGDTECVVDFSWHHAGYSYHYANDAPNIAPVCGLFIVLLFLSGRGSSKPMLPWKSASRLGMTHGRWRASRLNTVGGRLPTIRNSGTTGSAVLRRMWWGGCRINCTYRLDCLLIVVGWVVVVVTITIVIITWINVVAEHATITKPKMKNPFV